MYAVLINHHVFYVFFSLHTRSYIRVIFKIGHKITKKNQTAKKKNKKMRKSAILLSKFNKTRFLFRLTTCNVAFFSPRNIAF